MPPKAKFSKDEIIKAAVRITREKGIAAVTAREVGAVLGVSSRPLFTYFNTVESLKLAVYRYAKELYQQYVREGLTRKIPFLGVGQQYLRFAREEPELYRYLFLSPPEGMRGGAMEALKLSQELARDSLMHTYHMDAVTADQYFRDLWLVAYSFTTLIVTDECPYTDEEISHILTEFSISICMAYKKIPGLPEGNYDKETIFRKLVQI